MIKRTTLFNGLLGTFGALIAIAGALYMYSAHIEQPYLYYQNLPFPADITVLAGGAVELSVERCNRTAKLRTYRTTHALIDVDSRQSTLLPNVEVSIEPGCHRSVSRINVVPPDTKSGRYFVAGVATVEGAFVTHRVAWYSEPFDVIAREQPMKGEPGAPGPAGKVGKTGDPGRAGDKGDKGDRGIGFWGSK